MPRLVDHERRRAELVAAVWRLVLRHGVAGASVRAVAQEAGLSPGSVRYFFADQGELLRAAVAELGRRVGARVAAEREQRRLLLDADPVAAVLELLRQVLPVDAARVEEARLWAAFASHDATDTAAHELRAELDRDLHGLCEHAVSTLDSARALGRGRDAAAEARLLGVLLDGLTLRLLTPHGPSAESALDLLRLHLTQLAAPIGPARRRTGQRAAGPARPRH